MYTKHRSADNASRIDSHSKSGYHSIKAIITMIYGGLITMPKGNKKPVTATADSPNLIQNKYKETQDKHPEVVSRALNNAMMFAGDFIFDKNNPDIKSTIPPIKTPEECADRLNWFFHTCAETGQLPTIEKMYLALGIYRNKAYMWEYNGTNKEIRDLINQGKTLIAAMDSELASTGALQPVVWIFRAKNFYHLRDQIDIQASTHNPLEDNHKVIEEKYKDVITID